MVYRQCNDGAQNLINPKGLRNHIKLRQNKFKHVTKYKHVISKKNHKIFYRTMFSHRKINILLFRPI